MIPRCVRSVGVGMVLVGVLLPLRAPGSASDFVVAFIVGAMAALCADLYFQLDE